MLKEISGSWEAGDVVILKLELEPLKKRQALWVKYGADPSIKASYFALGFRIGDAFYHCKQQHTLDGNAFEMSLRPEDLAIKIDSVWETPDTVATHLEFWIKLREPSTGTVKLHSAEIVDLGKLEQPKPDVKKLDLCRQLLTFTGLSKFDGAEDDANLMLTDPILFVGPNCKVALTEDGDFLGGYEALGNSDRYMYHALGHVRILLIAYLHTKVPGMLELARQHTDRWLSENYENAPSDKKYAYYDHGAAERLIVLLTLWVILSRLDTEKSVCDRYLETIEQHARLVSSWSFANKNQPYFIHNHAIFQSISAMSAGIVLNNFSQSIEWVGFGAQMMKTQTEGLLSVDGVSIENSIDYHLGLQKVIRNAVRIIKMFDTNLPHEFHELPMIVERMQAFSDRVQYATNVRPATGDTKYTQNKNLKVDGEIVKTSDIQHTLKLFRSAGYGSIKGRTADGIEMSALMMCSALSLTHKHDDDLSISIATEDGIEWIADPGFHAYDTSEPSEYAKSVEAHNAPYLVDAHYRRGIDLSELAGGYDPDTGIPYIHAQHQHYDGIKIERDVRWIDHAATLVVKDTIRSQHEYESDFEIGFVLGDGVKTETLSDGAIRLSFKGKHGPVVSTDSLSFQVATDGRVFPLNDILNVDRLSLRSRTSRGFASHTTRIRF